MMFLKWHKLRGEAHNIFVPEILDITNTKNVYLL